MKKNLILAAAALSLAACSNPRSAAENFLQSLANGQVEEAKRYATPSTGKIIDLAYSLAGDELLDPDFEFRNPSDSVAGNRAWVSYEEKDGTRDTLELVKVDGDWLVSYSK